MTTKSVYNKLSGLVKPGTMAAIVLISGFWASLALALYYVGDAVIWRESETLALLFSGIFAVFFFLRSFGPWSKPAALLGLSSLAVLAMFFQYLCGSDYILPGLSTMSGMLLSIGLGMAGVFLDVGKYRRWAKAHRHSFNLNNSMMMAFHRATHF